MKSIHMVQTTPSSSKRNVKKFKKSKITFSLTPGFNPDAVIISESKDELGLKFYKTIRQLDSNEVGIDFPHITHTSEKYRIHCLAEEFNLAHFKRGTNKKKAYLFRNETHWDVIHSIYWSL